MMRFREQVRETAGFYNTVGFNDDTRPFLTVPGRHDVARRIDCSFLARLVAEHSIEVDEAFELARELTCGPPEAFVRWHPFGLKTELIWRGVFLSFAIGMLIAAFDPARRHRFFMIALVLSGYLHSAEMALDNLSSAAMRTMNGNREHLYGDVLGWCTIASLSLLFLASVRRGNLVMKHSN